MEKPFEAEEGPNKPSVTYILQCMQKDTDYEFYFECLVEELKLEGKLSKKTIVYCQTIKLCSILYGMIKATLGRIFIVELMMIQEMHLWKCSTPAHHLQTKRKFFSPSSQ